MSTPEDAYDNGYNTGYQDGAEQGQEQGYEEALADVHAALVELTEKDPCAYAEEALTVVEGMIG